MAEPKKTDAQRLAEKRARDQNYYETVTKPKREAERKAREAQAGPATPPEPRKPRKLIHIWVDEDVKLTCQEKFGSLAPLVNSHLEALAAGKTARYMKPKATSS
jgi:uncharacterized protein (DUF4415 family)